MTIKIDLHIHSAASRYKEDPGIVEDSTKDNLPVLLKKLHENEIQLFSITDHNRFDSDLYIEIDRLLRDSPDLYKNVKQVLAGVEFDVKLDPDKGKCHIICIFDAQNDPICYKKIEKVINHNLLTEKNNNYDKSCFERILQDIGLRTILIASQTKDISNHNRKNNDLSDAVDDVPKIIQMGYIDALEYQKPNIEGILLNSLNKLSGKYSLVSGSDCHTWQYYPKHDKNSRILPYAPTRARILPTFKGLLMAVTSPGTRFTYIDNDVSSFIEGVWIRDSFIKLEKGINAIIGENGSGKTTLLSILGNRKKEKYITKIEKDNNIIVQSNNRECEYKYISQNEIITKYNKEGTLFDAYSDLYKEVDHSEFETKYNSFSEQLIQYISNSIEKKKKFLELSKHQITYDPTYNSKQYFISVNINENFALQTDNVHEKPLKEITSILEQIEKVIQTTYFREYLPRLEKIHEDLIIMQGDIFKQWLLINRDQQLKNIIYSHIRKYNLSKLDSMSSQDRIKNALDKKKNSLVAELCNVIRLEKQYQEIPKVPVLNKKSGSTEQTLHGFRFVQQARYNSYDPLKDYLEYMFLKDSQNLDILIKIDTNEKFVKAVFGCTKLEDLKLKLNENFENFINQTKSCKRGIFSGDDLEATGSTLGELSLVYYKFITHSDEVWTVFMVDQPEDNISNSKISRELLSYFNSIRHSKQIIFVTHNPLLVVNLDVDNVIYLELDKEGMRAKAGCLEFEDQNTNILNLIAEKMDGGKEAVMKRMKVYG